MHAMFDIEKLVRVGGCREVGKAEATVCTNYVYIL